MSKARKKKVRSDDPRRTAIEGALIAAAGGGTKATKITENCVDETFTGSVMQKDCDSPGWTLLGEYTVSLGVAQEAETLITTEDTAPTDVVTEVVAEAAEPEDLDDNEAQEAHDHDALGAGVRYEELVEAREAVREAQADGAPEETIADLQEYADDLATVNHREDDIDLGDVLVPAPTFAITVTARNEEQVPDGVEVAWQVWLATQTTPMTRIDSNHAWLGFAAGFAAGKAYHTATEPA